jgi:hypothetical protein
VAPEGQQQAEQEQDETEAIAGATPEP